MGVEELGYIRDLTEVSRKTKRVIMDTFRRSQHASRSGGGGRTPRLERRNARKGFDYESGVPRSKGRRSLDSDHSSYDDSESSSHSREDLYALDEYRVMGQDSVEEMYQVCSYLGLPGPDSLGITREDFLGYHQRKFPTSHVIGTDSVSSVPQQDSSDFTFIVPPTPSYLGSPPQHAYREPFGTANDSVQEPATGNHGVTTSPSTLRKDAARLENRSGQNQVQEQEQLQERQPQGRSLDWRVRSTSLPSSQNRSFSPTPSSLVLAGTPRPLLGNRIFEYPDPVTYIQRVRSQPVSLPTDMSPGSGEERVAGDEKVQSGLMLGRNNVFRNNPAVPDWETVNERVADPASVITRDNPISGLATTREGDSSCRSSSCSDGSGEYSGRDAGRSPEQRISEKKQDVRLAMAPTRGTLRRPPPLTLVGIPCAEGLTTIEILDGLGPGSDFGRAVVERPDSGSDSDIEGDEQPQEQVDVGLVVPGTDDDSVEVVSGEPRDPVIDVRDRVPALQTVVTSTDGKKAADSRAPVDEAKDMVEVRPPEIESNGEPRSPSVVVPVATSPTGQIMLINLTQSPVPVEAEPVDTGDGEMGVQTLTFPWSKGDLLGAGSFGTVYEAVDSNGSFFAVKEVSLVVNDLDKNAQQCISQLEQEIDLLSRFKHDNIVRYLGTQRADGKLYIFLELVSKGSLASLCKKFRLTHSQIIAYTRQILKGLKYLHDMNVVHRDIKCANILVDVKGTCKLADFGLAKQISALDQLKSCKGSAYWMAPEVIDPKKTYWLPADIWSLGCSVLEMFTGSPPFGDQEWYRVLWKVGHGEAPPIPEHLSDDAKDFIRECLEVNPSKRPTATALLQHRFLSTGSTPTNSGVLNPQLVVSSLNTIVEERTGDFASRTSGTSRSLGDSPLSNGHSGH